MRKLLLVAAPILTALLLLSACERAPDTSTADTRALLPGVQRDSGLTSAPSIGWDTLAAGPMLVVAGDAPPAAVAVYPDYADSTLTDTTTFELGPVKGAKLDLFARSGRVGAGEIDNVRQPRPPAAGCTGWPSIGVASVGKVTSPWTVAFLAGRAQAIALDSVEALPRADSVRITTAVTRLAASAPNDTSTTFRRVPFVIRTLRRFTPARGVEAVVAEVLRKINQEASPRQEQLLLVGERHAGEGPYTIAYSERAVGLEEALVNTDVLGAVALGPERRPTLVLGRDEGDGGTYALLERLGDRKWRIRWTSAYAGC
ncbi:MAG: hypothetical protein NVS4B3_03830 [Gemmatimonadaceae bacterium]